MRWFSLLMAILALGAAALNLNAPDKWAWVAVYGFTAFSSLLAFFGMYNKAPLLVGIGLFVYYFFKIGPNPGMSWTESRLGLNTLGLLICLLWIGFLFLQSLKIKEQQREKDE